METQYVILGDGLTYEPRFSCEEDDFLEQLTLARRAEIVAYTGMVDETKIDIVKNAVAEMNRHGQFDNGRLEGLLR